MGALQEQMQQNVSATAVNRQRRTDHRVQQTTCNAARAATTYRERRCALLQKGSESAQRETHRDNERLALLVDQVGCTCC